MQNRVIAEITESNSWRYAEFAKFKNNAERVDEELWCRMCIPMIYAHWEGFIVSALKILLQYLNDLKLQPNKVEMNVLVYGLGEKYKPLSGKQSFEQRVEFTKSFYDILNSDLKFDKKINTKSNLNARVLAEFCQIFRFNYTRFNELTRDIDQLVNIRNSIAHGENSFVPDTKKIESFIKTVSDAIYIFLEEIDWFLKNKNYLLNPSDG